MFRLLTFVLIGLLASCHSSVNFKGEIPPRSKSDPLAPTLVNTYDYLMLEMATPTVLRVKDRMFFRFNVVAPWDKTIKQGSITATAAHNDRVILQKKNFTGASANKIGSNRTFVFSSLLLALKKGTAKITVKATCLVCDKDDNCSPQRVIRSVSFLVNK